MNDRNSSKRQATATTTTTLSKRAMRCRREPPPRSSCRRMIHDGLIVVVVLLAITASFGGEGIRVDAFSPKTILENSRWSYTTTATTTSPLTLLTATLSGDNDSSSKSTSTSSFIQQQGLVQNQDKNEKSDDPFQVGAVVRPRYLDQAAGAAAVGRTPPRNGIILPSSQQPSLLMSTTKTSSSSAPSIALAAAKCQDDDQVIALEMRRRNLVVAVASIALAMANYVYQFLHPLTPLQLLVDMQSHSAPISIIGKNPKPTVVDFWAPWCENCQRIAPALHELKQEYGDSINFVMINGDDPTAWPYIQALGVDAIPHLALVTADGYVQTALIGPIPKHILQDDLNAMVHKSNTLPHTMLDVFAGTESLSEARRVSF